MLQHRGRLITGSFSIFYELSGCFYCYSHLISILIIGGLAEIIFSSTWSGIAHIIAIPCNLKGSRNGILTSVSINLNIQEHNVKDSFISPKPSNLSISIIFYLSELIFLISMNMCAHIECYVQRYFSYTFGQTTRKPLNISTAGQKTYFQFYVLIL